MFNIAVLVAMHALPDGAVNKVCVHVLVLWSFAEASVFKSKQTLTIVVHAETAAEKGSAVSQEHVSCNALQRRRVLF